MERRERSKNNGGSGERDQRIMVGVERESIIGSDGLASIWAGWREFNVCHDDWQLVYYSRQTRNKSGQSSDFDHF